MTLSCEENSWVSTNRRSKPPTCASPSTEICTKVGSNVPHVSFETGEAATFFLSAVSVRCFSTMCTKLPVAAVRASVAETAFARAQQKSLNKVSRLCRAAGGRVGASPGGRPGARGPKGAVSEGLGRWRRGPVSASTGRQVGVLLFFVLYLRLYEFPSGVCSWIRVRRFPFCALCVSFSAVHH